MTISPLVHASFDWGSDCSQGNGHFSQQISSQAVVFIGEIPLNKQNVVIELNSDQDVDIQLFDKETGTAIVAWPMGMLSGPWAESTEYKGLEYEYSGYNGVNGEYGHEYIRINGVTNRVLVMQAFGYRSGDAIVNYAFEAVNTCKEKGNGAFSQYMPQGDVTEIGKIVSGKVNVDIYLNSIRDLDIQLFHGDLALVKWPDGQLRGPGKQSIVYEGMRIEWSGYEGTGGNFGHEYIKIRGIISKELTMKAFAFQYGTADVIYEWGVGAGDPCGVLGYSECLDGWVCKEGDKGDWASGIPGECHGKTWCDSNISADDDCEYVMHLAVPGRWMCDEFECVWDTRIVCPVILPPLPEACPVGWVTVRDANLCPSYYCPNQKCLYDTDCLDADEFCKKEFGDCNGVGTCTLPVFPSCPPPDPGFEFGRLCTCEGVTIPDYCSPISYLNIAHEGACYLTQASAGEPDGGLSDSVDGGTDLHFAHTADAGM